MKLIFCLYKADFLGSISDGLFKYYIADAAGSFEYKGQNYKLLSGYTVTLITILEPAIPAVKVRVKYVAYCKSVF